MFEPPDWRRLLANFEAPVGQQHTYRDMKCLTLYWREKIHVAPGHDVEQKRKVQVIYRRGLSTIPALLDQFDWACCQYAFDGKAVRTIGTTQRLRPGGKLRLANPQSPETSLARGRRFAERFGMTIDPIAVDSLQGLIAASGRLEMIARKFRKGPYRAKMAA